jgi:hypothetical protein
MRGHAVACLSLYKEGGVAAMVAFLAAYERDVRVRRWKKSDRGRLFEPT